MLNEGSEIGKSGIRRAAVELSQCLRREKFKDSNPLPTVGRVFVVLLALLMTQSVGATPLSNHTIWRGDFDADGNEDLYLESATKLIPVGVGGLMIFVPLAEEDSFLFAGNGAGGYQSGTVVVGLSTTGSTEQTSGTSLGDFDADGLEDLSIQANSAGGNSVILRQTMGVPEVLAVFSELGGMDTSISTSTMTMQDANGDGYADLLLTVGGQTHTFVNAGTGGFALNALPIIETGSQPQSPTTPVFASAPPIDPLSDIVGATPAEFRVDESGAASWSMPILTVPGAGGVAPQIALNYSSQGGYGIAGVGFNVSGLSAITRCRQTLEIDNANTGIALNNQDRFCLDGQRLVLVSGTYGAAGSEYRTEIDSQTRITAVGNLGGGPASFRVESKDGTEAVYGIDDGAITTGVSGDPVFVWAIDKLTDSVGNYYDFEYSRPQSNSLEFVVDRINYTGFDNGNGSLDENPFAHIQFNYEARPDAIEGYTSGLRMTRSQRLESIDSVYGSNVLRHYDLAYMPGGPGALSQLQSVQECSDGACMPATTFSWSNHSAWFESVASTGSVANGLASMQPADVDGDGDADVIYLQTTTSGMAIRWMRNVTAANNAGGFVDMGNIIANASASEASSWRVMDYNVDGYQDLIVYENNNWQVRPGGPGGFGGVIQTGLTSATPASASAVDVTGDGRADLVFMDNGVLKVAQLQPTGGFWAAQNVSVSFTCPPPADICTMGDSMSPTFGDFNGDGQGDILLNINEENIEILEDPFGGTTIENTVTVARGAFTLEWNASTGQFSATQFARMDNVGVYSTNTPTLEHLDVQTRVGDFNGDGLSDIAEREDENSTTWNTWISTGKAFVAGPTLTLNAESQLQFADVNEDGLQDAVHQSGSQWRVMLSTGTGFDPAIPIGVAAPADNKTLILDFDSDGKTDVLVVDDQTSYLHRHRDSFVAHNVIDTITNGLGARREIDYHSITDPNVTGLYTRLYDGLSKTWGQGAAVHDLYAPMYVVSEVRATAPSAGSSPGLVQAGTMASISYAYEGARVQAGGRGPLGFARLTTTDDQTNIVTSTSYRQDFPYIGRPLQTDVTHQGSLLSRSTNTWIAATKQHSGPNYHHIELGTAVEKSYDFGTHVSTATTTTQWDAYGNATLVTVTNEDEISSSPYVVTTVTDNDYADNVGLWHLGRLTRTDVTHSRTGEATVYRASTFAYDGTTGQLTTEVIQPGSGNAFALTTTHTHDKYGNRIRTDVTGWDGYSNVMRTTESTFNRGRFADSVTDSYGHTVTQVLARNNYGEVTLADDAVGLTTRNAYGKFGRPYFSSDETGTYTETIWRTCSQVACPTSGAYRVEVRSAGGGKSYSYHDALGREIRTSSVSFDGVEVHVDTEYDLAGRVIHKSVPYRTGAIRYWTRNQFDVLGRATQIHDPSGGTTFTTFSGLTTTQTNAGGQVRTEVRNVAGDLAEVTDHYGTKIRYRYNAQGNLRETVVDSISDGDVTTTLVHDLLGRKIDMYDPDMGHWEYEYNAFGELIKQTNALDQYTTMRYDELGRMTERRDHKSNGTLEGSAAWVWDIGANTARRLRQEDYQTASGEASILRVFEYDQLGRQVQTTSTIDGDTYVQSSTFDHLGRPFQDFDGVTVWSGVQYAYNSHGFMHLVREAGNLSTVHYEIKAMDALGNVTEIDKRGMTVTRSFDQRNGQPGTILAYDALNVAIQDMDFDFDAVLGNLTQRRDRSRGVNNSAIGQRVENFSYDDLNRMEWSQRNGTYHYVNYNAHGNITQKEGSNYQYASNRPHAVTSAHGNTYSYNANGSMTTGGGRTIEWSVFNKPLEMDRGSNTVSIAYGPNRSRFRRVDDEGGARTTTHYLPGVEFIETDTSYVAKRYIGGEIISTREGATTEDVVLLTDHLGSTHLVVDAGTHVVVEAQSFDPWGARRTPDGWSNLSVSVLALFDSVTTRGYTGHEQMDPVGLVHMNGRVYAPELGRFVSADPFVQAPENTQSYNRYSYVINNPLSLTDPSGYFFGDIAMHLVYKAVPAKYHGYINTAATVLAGFACGPGCAVAMAASSSFHSTFAQTGNLGKSIFAGASSAAFAAIGAEAASVIEAGGKVGAKLAGLGLGSALLGGTTSALSGGSFGRGFLVSGIGFGASVAGVPRVPTAPGRVAAGLVLGGTASAASGGKFANGVASATFSLAVRVGSAEVDNATKGLTGSQRRYLNKVLRRIRDGKIDIAELMAGDDLIGFYANGSEKSDAQLQEGLSTVLNTKRGREYLSVMRRQRILFVHNTKGVNASVRNQNIVFIDLNAKGTVPTVEGNTPIDPVRILAHELGHALFRHYDVCSAPGCKINWVENENAIMRELGRPERTEY